MTTGAAGILAISSQVAHGRVGLSAILPALHALGRGATALPTILLSNHPGHSATAGAPVPPDQLRAMIGALDANGWLADVGTVLTGYLPSAAHVAAAAEAIDRVRACASSPPRVVVDPVMGDDPKGLYVAAAAADAISETLAPRATVLTPNYFELRVLAGLPERASDAGLAGIAEAASGLRRRLGAAEVIVTSAPAGAGRLGNVSATEAGARAAVVEAAADAPNGVGDMFAALIAAGDDMARAVGRMSAVVRATADGGAPPAALAIVEAAGLWRDAPPAPAARLD